MSKLIETSRLCKKCNTSKQLVGFAKYFKKGIGRYKHVCLECARKSSRDLYKKSMKDPKKRSHRNERLAKKKKEKYHTDEQFRNKTKLESLKRYKEEKQDIIHFMKLKYKLDSEYRERKRYYNRISKMKLADDQYSNVYGFFVI